MSEAVIARKVALTSFLRSEAKAPSEDILPYQTRHRKLVPENDIWYQLLFNLSSLVPLAVHAMRKTIG
jgi:hypothetical protein